MTEAPKRIWEDQDNFTWVEADPTENMKREEVEYVCAARSTFPAGMRAGLEAAAQWIEQVPQKLADRQEIARAIRAIPVPERDPAAELVRAAEYLAAMVEDRFATAEDLTNALKRTRAALAKMGAQE